MYWLIIVLGKFGNGEAFGGERNRWNEEFTPFVLPPPSSTFFLPLQGSIRMKLKYGPSAKALPTPQTPTPLPHFHLQEEGWAENGSTRNETVTSSPTQEQQPRRGEEAHKTSSQTFSSLRKSTTTEPGNRARQRQLP